MASALSVLYYSAPYSAVVFIMYGVLNVTLVRKSNVPFFVGRFLKWSSVILTSPPPPLVTDIPGSEYYYLPEIRELPGSASAIRRTYRDYTEM